MIVCACSSGTGTRQSVPDSDLKEAAPETTASAPMPARSVTDVRMPNAFVVQAGRALSAGDLDTARKLVSKVDDSPQGLLVKARIATATGDHEEAVRLYHRMSDLEPVFEQERLEALAEALAMAGRKDEAALQVEALLRKGARSPSERLALIKTRAKWLLALGQVDKAVSAYKQARDLAGSPTEKDQVGLALGHALAASGRKAEASAILEALALRGATGPIMERAGEALATIGGEPKWDAETRLDRVRRLIDLRAYDEALATLEPIKHRGSREEADWLRAETLYERRGHYKEAVEALRPIASGKGPHSEEARLLMARALSRMDRDEEAIVAYHAFAQKTKNRDRATEARFFAARLEFYLGRHERSLAAFEKLVGNGKSDKEGKIADPARRRDAHFFAGLAAILTGNPGRAEPHLIAASHGVDGDEVRERNSYWVAVARTMAKKKGAFDALRAICNADATSWYARLSAKRLADEKQALGSCDLATVDWSWAREAKVGDLESVEAPASAEEEKTPLDAISKLAAFLAGAGFFKEAAEALNREEKRGTVKLPNSQWVAHYRALEAPHFAIRRASAGLSWPPDPDDRWRASAAYPTPYGNLVREMEETHKLPPFLLYAIARKESLFNPNAVSRVGAMGLMQMMPRTYETNRKRAGLPSLATGKLPAPEASIRAATFELSQLLTQFDQSLPLAIMAYNGGAQAVSRWVTRSGGLPLDVFVEKAGFAETRNYVRRVMKNLVRYRLLHGEPLPDLPERVSRISKAAVGDGPSSDSE